MADRFVSIVLSITLILTIVSALCVYSVVGGINLIDNSEQKGIITTGNAVDEKATVEDKFSVSREKMKISIMQSERVSEDIIIQNFESSRIVLKDSIEGSCFENIGFKPVPDGLNVESGESGKKTFEFSASDTVEPGVCTGKIVVSDGRNRKEIEVIMEVQSKNSEIKNSLTVRPDFREISSGGDLFINLKIGGVGGSVNNEYYVVSYDGGAPRKIDEEVIEFSDQSVSSRKLGIPSSLNQGRYLVYVKSILEGGVAVSGAEFSVAEKFEIDSEKMLNWSLILLVVLAIVSTIYMAVKIISVIRLRK